MRAINLTLMEWELKWNFKRNERVWYRSNWMVSEPIHGPIFSSDFELLVQVWSPGYSVGIHEPGEHSVPISPPDNTRYPMLSHALMSAVFWALPPHRQNLCHLSPACDSYICSQLLKVVNKPCWGFDVSHHVISDYNSIHPLVAFALGYLFWPICRFSASRMHLILYFHYM